MKQKHNNKGILITLGVFILLLLLMVSSVNAAETQTNKTKTQLDRIEKRQIKIIENQKQILARLRIIEARQIYAFIQWGWISVPYSVELKIKKACKIGNAKWNH